MKEFNILDEKNVCYHLEGFKPSLVDKKLLSEYGINYPIIEEVEKELIKGSEWYEGLFHNHSLNPVKYYREELTDVEEELEIHNYTGLCPTNVLEVSPSVGSCAVGCQYCLVTDGKHVKDIVLYTNYTDKLASSLKRNRAKKVFYYFSPKTEAFSEPHLFSGMAHEILRTFIRHYDIYPDSLVRLFIATKVGSRHFEVQHQSESIYELLVRLKTKVQINGSIGIMPIYLRNILEPNAAGIKERLEVLGHCRDLGIWAESVLCQPLFIPYLNEESITEYMSLLADAGVKNIKPEFFTAEVRNLVLVAQYINYYDKNKLGEFFYPYLRKENQNHIKQRARLAPDKDICIEKLELIHKIAQQYGITISICNWVKRELSEKANWIKNVDNVSAENGYKCLGYQFNLFK